MKKPRLDRSSQITIRLDPKIMAGLREFADQVGIAPTTLGGLAIGEFVAKNKAVVQNQGILMESIGRELGRAIGGPIETILGGKSAQELTDLFEDKKSPEQQTDIFKGP